MVQLKNKNGTTTSKRSDNTNEKNVGYKSELHQTCFMRGLNLKKEIKKLKIKVVLNLIQINQVKENTK